MLFNIYFYIFRYSELMEKLVLKIPSTYWKIDSENTGGALSYYLYELIQDNCLKINKTFKEKITDDIRKVRIIFF